MKPVRLAGLLLALGLTACIEDPSAVEGPPLSPDELRLLGFELAATTLEARLEAGVDEDAPGAGGTVPVVVDREATGTRPCALGGEVEVTASASGSYDDVTRVGAIAFHIVADPDDCRRQRGGLTFELNGWPDVVADLDFARDPAGILTLSGAIDGAVLFERGDQDGTGICFVDLALDGSVDRTQSSSLPVRVSGTLCGATLDATTTIEL